MTDALRADEFDLMLSTLRYVLGAGQAPNGTTARDHYNAIINSIASRVERTQDADVRLACEIVKRAALAAPAVPPGWQPIETAPDDGQRALVYRPLAELSGDQPIAIKRLVGGNADCWPKTVPAGSAPTNPTDGACHVTHWMPLPASPTAPPVNQSLTTAAQPSESNPQR